MLYHKKYPVSSKNSIDHEYFILVLTGLLKGLIKYSEYFSKSLHGTWKYTVDFLIYLYSNCFLILRVKKNIDTRRSSESFEINKMEILRIMFISKCTYVFYLNL